MTLFVLLLLLWPFTRSAPKCGENSECYLLDHPADVMTAGVLKPIARIFRNGKQIPFEESPEKSVGPYAVKFRLDKTDSKQEMIVFEYKKDK